MRARRSASGKPARSSRRRSRGRSYEYEAYRRPHPLVIRHKKSVRLPSEAYGEIVAVIIKNLPNGGIGHQRLAEHFKVSTDALVRWFDEHALDLPQLVEEYRLKTLQGQLLGFRSDPTASSQERSAQLDRIAETIGITDSRGLRLFLRTPTRFNQDLRVDLLRNINGDQPIKRVGERNVPVHLPRRPGEKLLVPDQIETELTEFMRRKVMRRVFTVSFGECVAHLGIRTARLNDWLATFDDRSAQHGCIKTRGVRRLMIAARLKEAERLVRESDLSLPEVARLVGYSGAKTLEFNYKRMTGRSLGPKSQAARPRTACRPKASAMENDWNGENLERRVTSWVRLNLWRKGSRREGLSEALGVPFRRIQTRLAAMGTSVRFIQGTLRLADAKRRLKRAGGDAQQVSAEVGYYEAHQLAHRMKMWSTARSRVVARAR